MSAAIARPFRFHDNHEKYLLFANTCGENEQTARRVAAELERLNPTPPGLSVYQTGSGDGTLLNLALRRLHRRWPNIPFQVVVKERNPTLLRIAARHLADRFMEHPELVLVFTSASYQDDFTMAVTEAGEPAPWLEVPLAGDAAHAFDGQINDLLGFVREHWPAESGAPPARERIGARGVTPTPATVVLYRDDQRFALHRVIPRPEEAMRGYDLIIASQPYRSRLPAAEKARTVLAPLAERLAPEGRMITVQATGRDPGMEIVRAIWPEEDPFPTPRAALVSELRQRFEVERADLTPIDPVGDSAEFRYRLQLNPEDVQSSIGTSTLLAAWNAAAYVAQLDEDRLTEAMSSGDYLEATGRVLHRHRGLWFVNECFLVTRSGE